MRLVFYSFVLLSVVLTLSACGNKGKLKSPSRIQYEQEKKERREARMKMGLPGVEEDEPEDVQEVREDITSSDMVDEQKKSLPSMPSNDVAQ